MLHLHCCGRLCCGRLFMELHYLECIRLPQPYRRQIVEHIICSVRTACCILIAVDCLSALLLLLLLLPPSLPPPHTHTHAPMQVRVVGVHLVEVEACAAFESAAAAAAAAAAATNLPPIPPHPCRCVWWVCTWLRLRRGPSWPWCRRQLLVGTWGGRLRTATSTWGHGARQHW
jgi:hypothetical protein